jgi:hypothetical protein
MAAGSIVTVGATATKEASNHNTAFPLALASSTETARSRGKQTGNLAQKGLSISYTCPIRLIMARVEAGSAARREVRK